MQGGALLLQGAGDQESKLERLARVEPWIAMSVVAIGQRLLGHGAGAAGALRVTPAAAERSSGPTTAIV